jgi:hypothetical protein
VGPFQISSAEVASANQDFLPLSQIPGLPNGNQDQATSGILAQLAPDPNSPTIGNTGIPTNLTVQPGGFLPAGKGITLTTQGGPSVSIDSSGNAQVTIPAGIGPNGIEPETKFTLPSNGVIYLGTADINIPGNATSVKLEPGVYLVGEPPPPGQPDQRQKIIVDPPAPPAQGAPSGGGASNDNVRSLAGDLAGAQASSEVQNVQAAAAAQDQPQQPAQGGQQDLALRDFTPAYKPLNLKDMFTPPYEPHAGPPTNRPDTTPANPPTNPPQTNPPANPPVGPPTNPPESNSNGVPTNPNVGTDGAVTVADSGTNTGNGGDTNGSGTAGTGSLTMAGDPSETFNPGSGDSGVPA